jgi:hypothetical protein
MKTIICFLLAASASALSLARGGTRRVSDTTMRYGAKQQQVRSVLKKMVGKANDIDVSQLSMAGLDGIGWGVQCFLPEERHVAPVTPATCLSKQC